jgi:cysteine desulfurase
MKPIYLDYNASTPIAPEVVDAMRPFLSQHYGNPSSHHWAGAPAKDAIEKTRSQVAARLGCSPQEIIFTSGGTEANNRPVQDAQNLEKLRAAVRLHIPRMPRW